MHPLTVAAALAACLSVCGIARAEPAPPLFLAANSWVCPAMGWLTGSTDREKLEAKCSPAFALLGPERVVVLDADFPFAFVCQMSPPATPIFDGKLLPKKRQLMCGYALQRDLRDARGYDQGFKDVEQAAQRSSMADVHRLP